MMFYKTNEEFVCCSEFHSDFFERNFEFEDKFRIRQATIIYPKDRKKSYGAVSKKDLEECLIQTIKKYAYELKQIEKLTKKFKLKKVEKEIKSLK